MQKPMLPARSGMMPGRAHAAEGTARLTTQHQIDRLYHRPGSAQGRLQAVRVHGGVRIDPDEITRRGQSEYTLHIGRCMYPDELLAGSGGRVVAAQRKFESGLDQPVLDHRQSCR